MVNLVVHSLRSDGLSGKPDLNPSTVKLVPIQRFNSSTGGDSIAKDGKCMVFSITSLIIGELDFDVLA